MKKKQNKTSKVSIPIKISTLLNLLEYWSIISEVDDFEDITESEKEQIDKTSFDKIILQLIDESKKYQDISLKLREIKEEKDE